MEDVGKSMEYLTEAEELGCDVLCLREEILRMHARANECREAASEVRRGADRELYMYEGSLLVRGDAEQVLARLADRHKQLQTDIKRKSEQMRDKVFRLQDLEMQLPYRGRELVPIDKDELKALSQVWGANA